MERQIEGALEGLLDGELVPVPIERRVIPVHGVEDVVRHDHVARLEEAREAVCQQVLDDWPEHPEISEDVAFE